MQLKVKKKGIKNKIKKRKMAKRQEKNKFILHTPDETSNDSYTFQEMREQMQKNGFCNSVRYVNNSSPSSFSH